MAVDAGATDGEVVHRENKLRLVRYRPTAGRAGRTPHLLACAVVNRPYVLDLLDDRSVVRAFLDRGFDVYLLDWGEPSALDADLGLADYVERYLANCVDRVRDRSGTDAVHLFGYCTGGTLAAAYAALHPGAVRSLVLLAPLPNLGAEGRIFRFWGREKGHDAGALVGAFGNAPGEWLAVEFSMTEPVEFYLGRYPRLYRIDDPHERAAFARRHRWGLDTVDVPGRLYREFMEDLYGGNALLEGDLVLDGERVDPSAIDAPCCWSGARTTSSSRRRPACPSWRPSPATSSR